MTQSKPGIHSVLVGLILVTVVSQPALAAASDVERPPFPVAGKFSRGLQSITGLNFISGVVASYAARRVLRRKLGGGDISVRVKPYSFTDMLSGKIKSVNIRLERCLVKAVPIGHLQITSANPLYYDPGFRGHKRGLRSAIMFNINAHLNRDQVASALNNPKVTAAIRGLKLDLPGLGAQQIRIIRPNVELTDGVVKIDATLVTEGASEETGVPISISGRPEIEGARIYLRQLKVDSPDIPNPDEFASFTAQLFNPIYDLGRLDRKTHALRLTEIAVKSDGLTARGTLVLAPRPSFEVAEKRTKTQM